ncbi:MAG: hypothetical protein LBH93_08130 [Chitinispirillales bacterium]|jgi:uncharacterized membrane protein|nr:hypothetical protein [Chitinispirillales bacterium]
MDAIKIFLAERGFTLMVCGIIMAAAGVLLYALLNTPRYGATFYPRAAMGVAIAGFAVYFTGRVSVAVQRSRSKRRVAARPEDDGL